MEKHIEMYFRDGSFRLSLDYKEQIEDVTGRDELFYFTDIFGDDGAVNAELISGYCIVTERSRMEQMRFEVVQDQMRAQAAKEISEF
jgi:hypothetical protein